jgi:hypothetical protein
MNEGILEVKLTARDLKCLIGCLTQYLADSQGFDTPEDHKLLDYLYFIAEREGLKTRRVG